jgi:nucleotide-binding universal stress UspA family protein
MSMLEPNHLLSPVREDGQRRFSRICVAVNDSVAAESATRLGLSLVCGQSGAEVAFCHVLNIPRMVERAEQSLDDYGLALRAARERAHLMLARCRILAHQAGVFARSYIRYGSPATEIRSLADGLGADLVLAGNGSAGKLHRLINGSVRDELAATCSLPILIVSAKQKRAPQFRPRRILVPAADAPTAWAAKCVAADLATDFATELVLLPGADDGNERQRQVVNEAIRTLEPGLIVMAASRRRFHGIFAEVLSERVMQDDRAPVLLVRTVMPAAGAR